MKVVVHLSAFVLCALLSFSPYSDAQSCQWQYFPNTNIFGGKLTNATSLQDCADQCRNTAPCLSIDWSLTNSQCFLLNQTAGKNNATGVDHYDLNCAPQGCVWQPFPNMNIYGGVQNSAASLGACQIQCIVTPPCVSIDWSLTNSQGSNCYLLNQITGKNNATNVYHYDLICNSSGSSPGPISTTSTSIPTASVSPGSGCVWQTFLNTNIFGGKQNSATSIEQCQSQCIATPGCVSVDWSLSNTPGSQCFLLNQTTGKNYANNVTHYDLNCTSQGNFGCVWQPFLNTNIFGGKQNSATSIEQCQSQCIATPGCVSVDWSLSNTPGSQCFLLNQTTGKNYANNVTHYDLNCTTSVLYRLAGSNIALEGRLEVQYRNIWGTVCDDIFDNVDASVACRSLGYSFGGETLNNMYGPGGGPIWLDDVGCSGTEQSIDNCYHQPWNGSNCQHGEDVSIRCYSSTTIFPISSTAIGGGIYTTIFRISSTAASQCWVPMSNTNVASGTGNPAPTLAQCLAACQAQPISSCSSIDWDNIQRNGSQCYLHQTSQSKNPSQGVDHYDRIC